PSSWAICSSERFNPMRYRHRTQTRSGRWWPAKTVPLRSSNRVRQPWQWYRWRSGWVSSQYRLTEHNHSLSKGFLQGRQPPVFRALLLPVRLRLLDGARVDPAATRVGPLALHLPEQPAVPRPERRGRPRVAFREATLQDLKNSR